METIGLCSFSVLSSNGVRFPFFLLNALLTPNIGDSLWISLETKVWIFQLWSLKWPRSKLAAGLAAGLAMLSQDQEIKSKGFPLCSLCSLWKDVEGCVKLGARLRKSIKLNFKQLKTEIVRFKIISTGLLLASAVLANSLWFHCTSTSLHITWIY